MGYTTLHCPGHPNHTSRVEDLKKLGVPKCLQVIGWKHTCTVHGEVPDDKRQGSICNIDGCGRRLTLTAIHCMQKMVKGLVPG